MSEGHKKSDGSAVTVFTANKPSLHNLLEPARHHFDYCKKLRHPMLLKVEATLDTDNPDSTSAAPPTTTKGDWIVVTEPCISLEKWLATAPSSQELAWGLQCMISALDFLHSSAKLCHGNISPTSWKVTPGGDVKLWNYSIVTPGDISNHFQHYERSITPLAYRSPERGDWNLCKTSPIHSMDAYSLGVLIQTDLYPGTVPASLQKALQRLISSNPKMRPRLQGLQKCPLFQTEYSKLQQELQEYQVQSVEMKIQFWSTLSLKNVTQRVARYKLLPTLTASITQTCTSDSLLKQDLYRRELLGMLHVLVGIWEQYDDGNDDDNNVKEDYTALIGLLMGVQDRAIRGVLLQKMNLLQGKIVKNNKASINSALFEPMCSGFSDSSAALRELTLKASLQLVAHLSPSNLEKLSRYLIRLQSDPEPSIRTNAIVLIVKVAPQLGDVQREKLLISALQRSLKDVFFPCRLSGMQAIFGYQDFTEDDLATRVLPMVVPHLLDSSTEVRDKAFAVVSKCLGVLKQKHETMSLQQVQHQQNVVGTTASTRVNEMPATTAPAVSGPPTTTAVPPGVPSSGSGYLSGLSSWMSSSTKPETVAASSGGIMPSSTPVAGTTGSMAATSYATQTTPTPSIPQTTTQPTPSSFAVTMKTTTVTKSLAATQLDDSWGEEDDGWGDEDDDDLLDVKPTNVTSFSARPPVQLPTNDEEDFFKSFDMKPKVPVRTSGKLVVPKSKTTPAPAVTKLKVDKSDWDDF